MSHPFHKLCTELDFDRVQEQKETLLSVANSAKLSQTDKDRVVDVVEFLDQILDIAETRGLWNFEKYCEARNLPEY